MADNREPPEGPNNPVKLDQVRNMPGGALLRTIPGSQGRFMMATPVQSSAALLSTTTIQTQVLPKVTGPGGPAAGVSRLSTVPIQAPSATTHFNHVPRGAAAVANISVPRSSVATPIVQRPATLQTIGVPQQHTLPTSVTNPGRPVLGVACLPGQQRPPPIPVGARLVSSQMRPIGDASRPVLLHSHKQVTLTQQQVQSTFQMSGAAVKSYSNVTRHPSTPSLSRITATLPPGMVQLPATVFLPSQPIKPQPQPKVNVITQAHGPSVQIPSTASVPQTLSISTVVSRPVVLGSGAVGSTVRPAGKPSSTTPTEPNQQLYISGARSTILVRETPRTKESEPISISVSSTQTTSTSTATGVNTIYTLPGAGSYFEGGAVRPLVTLASRTTQGVPTTTAPPSMRLNSLMVVEQPQPPRIHTIVPTTSAENSHLSLPISENSSIIAGSVAGVPLTLAKQITSPRPSILRKRDPEGSPMKGAKNLTPLLTGLGRGGSPPPGLPPSPPGKRPESSSGGSTTVSANSSPGESPPAPSLPPKEEEETLPQPPPPQLRVLPPEVSPRKKPRKQQLTGNQITEPTFSEDEMEFITEEKIKKEIKEEEMEPKVIPKRKNMSLLSTYKHLWKPRNNHFMRYTDVKAKEEKVPSLSELANQKHALQKINGWKIYHLGSQIEDVVNSEDEFIDFYNSLLNVLEVNQKKNKNKDIHKEYSSVNERVRANFQRTKVAKDQMLDAKSLIMKFVDHKSYIADLINKNISKRGTNKKRERI